MMLVTASPDGARRQQREHRQTYRAPDETLHHQEEQAIAHALGFVTRLFRTIDLWLQPRLSTALTHICGQPLAMRPIENGDTRLV
jgi:hypothetical protein